MSAPPGSRTQNLRIKSPVPSVRPVLGSPRNRGFRPDRSPASAAKSATVRGVCRQVSRQTERASRSGEEIGVFAVRHGGRQYRRGPGCGSAQVCRITVEFIEGHGESVWARMFVPVFDSALTPVVQTDGVGFGCKRFLLTSRGSQHSTRPDHPRAAVRRDSCSLGKLFIHQVNEERRCRRLQNFSYRRVGKCRFRPGCVIGGALTRVAK